jgi:hypothetical protein
MPLLRTAVLLLAFAAAGCEPRKTPVEPRAQPAAPTTPAAKPPSPATASPAAISSFEDCVAAGNPIAESYPPQCRTADGSSFTEDVGNRVELQGLIQIDEPTPNQRIASPLTIQGKARGPWFFEASFPVTLRDARGATLASGIVQATGEWMTEDFVPFRHTLTFTVPPGVRKGTLVFSKSNASGLPEHDAELRVPVGF